VLPEVSSAARNTIQGTIRVAIRLSVDSSGNVAAATFDYRGPSGYFADRAMQAARQWKFAPAAGNVPGEWLLRFEITRSSTNAFADLANP
jgi:TonB family protein